MFTAGFILAALLAVLYLFVGTAPKDLVQLFLAISWALLIVAMPLGCMVRIY